jgi:hypothetical protein
LADGEQAADPYDEDSGESALPDSNSVSPMERDELRRTLSGYLHGF